MLNHINDVGMTKDFKLTDGQKRQLAKLMGMISGKLELVLEYKGEKLINMAYKDEVTFDNMTNVITELTEYVGNYLKVKSKEFLPSEKKAPLDLKVKYMGEYMVMAHQEILPSQMLVAFESMSITIQRGIDNAKNGIFESNMIGINKIN